MEPWSCNAHGHTTNGTKGSGRLLPYITFDAHIWNPELQISSHPHVQFWAGYKVDEGRQLVAVDLSDSTYATVRYAPPTVAAGCVYGTAQEGVDVPTLSSLADCNAGQAYMCEQSSCTLPVYFDVTHCLEGQLEAKQGQSIGANVLYHASTATTTDILKGNTGWEQFCNKKGYASSDCEAVAVFISGSSNNNVRFVVQLTRQHAALCGRWQGGQLPCAGWLVIAVQQMPAGSKARLPETRCPRKSTSGRRPFDKQGFRYF
eukprot:scaffold286731_cov19-Tisochrysis_lutea.AAC.2